MPAPVRFQCRFAVRRRGALLVLVALLMIVFLAMAAFSVDVAYMDLTQTQLRAATDAAARAGGESLSRTREIATARLAAKTIAESNFVAGKSLKLRDDQIVFGKAMQGGDGVWSFTPDEQSPNGVRVIGKRTHDSDNGSVSLFFGGILGTPYFEPIKTSTVVFTTGSRDICLVADRSHSMAWDTSGVDWQYPRGGFTGQCYPPHATLSRWAALVSAAREFHTAITAQGGEDYIALVTFASALTVCRATYPASRIDVDLTRSFSSIDTALSNITKGAIPGNTNIYAGIQDGIKVLTGPKSRAGKSKIIILMTDGLETDGPPSIQAARDAASKGITIHTVTFSNGADKVGMTAVANATGGKHYHANTAAELIDVYRQLAFASQGLAFAE